MEDYRGKIEVSVGEKREINRQTDKQLDR